MFFRRNFSRLSFLNNSLSFASLLHNQRVGGFVNLVFLVNLVILVKQVILIKLVISDKSGDSGNSGETCYLANLVILVITGDSGESGLSYEESVNCGESDDSC